MALDIEKEIKINFIALFIVAIIYGLWYLISVESWVAATNWPYLDPVAGRVLGGIFTTIAIISLKAFKEADQWEKIENIVIFMLLACIFEAIISIYCQIAFNLPPSAILNIIIYVVFAILNLHILMQKRK
jgi:hypothetical protein